LGIEREVDNGENGRGGKEEKGDKGSVLLLTALRGERG